MLNSLLSYDEGKQIDVSDKTVTANQLHFYLHSLLAEKQKFKIMRERNGFELIKILGQIRSRISFYFLYFMCDQDQIKDEENKGQDKNIKHLGSHLLEHD